MKIRKVEKLLDLLDEDMSWRKKELIDLRMLIHSTKNPSLCRSGIALLSAHFEGFFKQAANYYLVHVSSQKKCLSDLKINFLAIYCQNKFQKCSESSKYSVLQKALESVLNSHASNIFHLSYTSNHPIIKTEGNPSSAVIKEVIESIGLDFSPYETKKKYIDSDLLSNRHGIVHGERIQITILDFETTFSRILEIMEQFKNQIIDAALNKKYLKDAGTALLPQHPIPSFQEPANPS